MNHFWMTSISHISKLYYEMISPNEAPNHDAYSIQCVNAWLADNQ